MSKRLAAEFMGTLWLVLGGCGSAVLAGSVPESRHRHPGRCPGFRSHGPDHGLCHRTDLRLSSQSCGVVGLVDGGPLPGRELPGYIVAQVLGAIIGAGILYVIATGSDLHAAGRVRQQRLRSTLAWPVHAVGRALTEIVMTFMFLMIILGATDRRAPAGFAPLAIGLALTLIHLISIPVTNTSVNPARSTGPAIFVGGWALEQLWLFWVAPIAGALLAGLAYRFFDEKRTSDA